MNPFTYKKGQLFAEGVPVKKIAKQVGTPFYLYSRKALTDQLATLQKVFQSVKPMICFSVKSNSNLAVLKTLVKKGAGLDIVSGGELYRALKVGCPPSRIVFAGVGKTSKEIREALRAKIFCFNVESIPELEAIQREARKLKVTAPVALRVNPNVTAKTHKYITTGSSENKFGIALEQAEQLVAKDFARFDAIRLRGFHVHIGSQITDPKPFLKAIERVGKMITRLRKQGTVVEWLNLGGGLGIVYDKEKPLVPKAFARTILPLCRKLKLRLIFEPGRFIAGNSGILVTQVLYIKKTDTKQFAIVDGAMTDLIRPSLYQAYHVIQKVNVKSQKAKDISTKVKRQKAKVRYDVVGPVCESGDFFGKNRLLPPLETGDLLALLSAGAYGFTMASHYNTRPKVPEVMVRGNRFAVIRKRETYKDLIHGEKIPHSLF